VVWAEGRVFRDRTSPFPHTFPSHSNLPVSHFSAQPIQVLTPQNTRTPPRRSKDAGNPILLDLKTRYNVKGLGTEKIIDSVVKIHTGAKGERITAVEDRWNGNIPDGAFAKIRVIYSSLEFLLPPAIVVFSSCGAFD
jgi:GTPase